jgi:hypothetical protein
MFQNVYRNTKQAERSTNHAVRARHRAKRNPSAAPKAVFAHAGTGDRTGFTQSRIDSGRCWQMPLIYLCDSPPKSHCGHRITEKIIFGARRLAGDLLETYQKENLRPQTTPNAVGGTQLALLQINSINSLIRNLSIEFEL